jgi:hypothetical protein
MRGAGSDDTGVSVVRAVWKFEFAHYLDADGPDGVATESVR